MATGAKRLGLDVNDIELELRLRRIETELANRVRLNDYADGETVRVTTIPIVSGLRVAGSTAGAITLAWTAIKISDLKRYEVDIAEDLGFSVNKTTNFVAGTEFAYTTNSATGGGGNTAVFVRVRAKSQTGNVGPYSVVLDAITGQAQTADIADASVGDSQAASSLTIQLALKEYITPRGFHLSNDTTDAKNDVVITAGVARAESNGGSIEVAATLIKRMNETWLAGSLGGFPESQISRVDGTWYRVFAIAKADGTGGDAGFDTSATAANLIAQAASVNSGYTNGLYRQIGWIYWISTGVGIRTFRSPTRQPEKVFFTSDIVSLLITETTSAATAHTLDVPPDVTAIYGFKIVVPDDAGQDNRYLNLTHTAVTDAAASATNFTHHIHEETETDQVFFFAHQELEVDSSSQINVRYSGGVDNNGTLYSQGFIFHR